MIIYRTEQIWLNPSEKISKVCHISKNIYNEANYIIRQEFFKTGKWIRYNALTFELKTSENYRQLPAQTSQQILKILDKNWKSFFEAIKEWKKNLDRFEEKPGLPKYKKKDGEFMLVFTNQQAKIVDGLLVLPKKIKRAIGEIKTKVNNNLREVRIIPKAVGYILEIIYEKIIKPPKRDKNRIAGIDLGVRNLVTIANNIGKQPIIVKGGVAKSINQYFNKKKARIQRVYDKQKIDNGLKMKKLLVKRDKKLHDYLHKVSRRIVDYLVENNIGLLVIGHNVKWKQRANIGKRNNQSFVTIPFYKLYKMLQYKAEEQGIEVVFQDENHTSKCSFFDKEPIKHHNKYVGRRKRGLFKTAKGYIVNADVNGALNIMKKAVPDALTKYADGIEGVVEHPSRLIIPC